MEHFVTLFDMGFAPQGLALWRSLRRHAPESMLWVLAMDEEASAALRKLELEGMRVIDLSEVMTPSLEAACADRQRSELCWTLTPRSIQAVLSLAFDAHRVTYVDADVWFRRPPGQLLAGLEQSRKTVQITEHAYTPVYDQSADSGIYCVQFVTFGRGQAEHILDWWAQRCEEWCYARFEDGKFGDQKYLDDWPERFSDEVHVLDPPELMLAPWNVGRFPIGRSVAYHFHGLRITSNRRVLMARGYALNRSVIAHVYDPYLEDLSHAIALLRAADLPVRLQGKRPGLIEWLGITVRKLQRFLASARPVRYRIIPNLNRSEKQ